MSSSFKQGDIIWFDFPSTVRNPQFTIRGRHPAIILHDDTHPNQTITLSPVSSLHKADGTEKEMKSFHLVLRKSKYPELDNDSFAKLDQIMTFTRDDAFCTPICCVDETDKATMHLKLMESLQMHETVSELTKQQLDQAVETVLQQFLDDYMQQHMDQYMSDLFEIRRDGKNKGS